MSNDEEELLDYTSEASAIPSQENISSYSSKVSEIFYTAGEAFNRLGEIAVRLNSIRMEPGRSRWSGTEIECLKGALIRFSNDLEYVSDSLLKRSKPMILRDAKRRKSHLSSGMMDDVAMSSSATNSGAVNEVNMNASAMKGLHMNGVTMRNSAMMGDSAMMGNAPRTSFRSTINARPNSCDTNLSPRAMNEELIEVPHVAETQIVAEALDESMPIISEEPPVLIPARRMPVKKEVQGGIDNTYMRRGLPNTVVQSVRRLPISIRNRSGGQSSLRLINSASGMTPIVRQRFIITNDNALSNQSFCRTSRNVPYARVSTNSPQLVSASKTRLIPTTNVASISNNDSTQINWSSHQWRL